MPTIANVSALAARTRRGGRTGNNALEESAYKSPFARLDIEKIKELAALKNTEGFKETQLFLSGDHFNDGALWMGPPDRASPAYVETMKKIKKQFVFRDVIDEILSRVVNGVAKKEPRLGADMRVVAEEDEKKPFKERVSEEDQNRIIGLTRTLGVWWNTNTYHEKLKKVIRYARAHGHGYMRLWIPVSQLEDIPEEERAEKAIPDGVKRVPTGSFEQTLKRIFLDIPDPSACVIIIDEETQQKASIFTFKRDDMDFAEISWVEYDEFGEPGPTIVRVIGGTGRRKAVMDFEWELGGRLPIIEMEAPILIKETIRVQQKRLNFFETSLMRNVETAGFPERVITNAEPTGILVRRAPGAEPGPYPVKLIEGITYEVHPVPRTIGSGLTTEVQGRLITDPATKAQTLATPGVHRFEPVDPEGTIRAARHAYQLMLEQAHQGHILIVGDATASGVSRESAEGDFLSDLSDTRAPAENLVVESLETLVAIAEYFSSETYLDTFRLTADLSLTPGAASADSQRLAYEQRDKGVISTTEAMSRSGVEDPHAMMTELEQDPEFIMNRLVKRAETMDKLQLAGWTFEGAARAVGFTEEEIKAARQGLDLSEIRQDPNEEGDPDAEDTDGDTEEDEEEETPTPE